MRKTRCLCIVLALTLSLIGCGNTNLTQSEAESPVLQEAEFPVPEEAFRYNDYISAMLFLDDAESGFSDASMSAFAISQAIFEASLADSSFNPADGVSKETLNAITQKYFDATVSNFENQFTTVLDSGLVASTGWSPSAHTYILKELQSESDGSQRGIFYRVPGFYGESETYEEYLDNLRQARFDLYGEVDLVELRFYEKTDETGGFYMQFVSAQAMGPAQSPYEFHTNSN